jgi:ABC-type spermidine/putrescine transport system permease subunit I
MTRSDGWRELVRPLLLAAPATVLLLALLLGPLLYLLRVSLYEEAGGNGFFRPGTWTLQEYHLLATDPYYRDVLTFTVLLAGSVTGLTVALAYPLALFIHSLGPRQKGLALTVILLPKVASVLVVIYGLELVLSNAGPVNQVLLALGVVPEPVMLFHNLTGVVVGETYLIVPYAVLILVAALGRMDPTLVPAARGLGATPWQAFRRITWPLSLPGLALAAQLSLIWALGAFLGPLLLGSPQEATLAVEVQRQTFEHNNWPRGAATAVLMLLTLGACFALYALATRSRRRGEEVG